MDRASREAFWGPLRVLYRVILWIGVCTGAVFCCGNLANRSFATEKKWRNACWWTTHLCTLRFRCVCVKCNLWIYHCKKTKMCHWWEKMVWWRERRKLHDGTRPVAIWWVGYCVVCVTCPTCVLISCVVVRWSGRGDCSENTNSSQGPIESKTV